jgi:hypothetical protein
MYELKTRNRPTFCFSPPSETALNNPALWNDLERVRFAVCIQFPEATRPGMRVRFRTQSLKLSTANPARLRAFLLNSTPIK